MAKLIPADSQRGYEHAGSPWWEGCTSPYCNHQLPYQPTIHQQTQKPIINECTMWYESKIINLSSNFLFVFPLWLLCGYSSTTKKY